MKKYSLQTIIGFVILFSTCGLTNAQSVRLQPKPAGTENQLISPDLSDPVLVTPAFPVYTITGNTDSDEKRFTEMVHRWNNHFPNQALDAETIRHIRSGTSKSATLSRSIPKSDPVALRLLQEANLMRMWGHPEMPVLPDVTGENSGLIYQEWLHQVKQWVASSETLQKQSKGLSKQPYPYAQNPTLDPDYPVFKDTGNPEKDAIEYHEQKLRYSEKLNQYSK